MQVVVSKKSGKVLCVHAAKGSCHDFQLFKQSRLLLARALKVLADSGYQGIKKYHQNSEIPIKSRWCPKMYAASNKSVVDIEKSDGKCLNVIEHLLGKTAGFTHRTAYPLA